MGLAFVNSFRRRPGRKSSRLPILPPFWPNDPKGYFSACKTLLEASRIKDEALRYNALLNALTKSPDTLRRVHDMLPTVNVKAPYTELKRKLIERFSTTGKQCLSGLLSMATSRQLITLPNFAPPWVATKEARHCRMICCVIVCWHLLIVRHKNF